MGAFLRCWLSTRDPLKFTSSPPPSPILKGCSIFRQHVWRVFPPPFSVSPVRDPRAQNEQKILITLCLSDFFKNVRCEGRCLFRIFNARMDHLWAAGRVGGCLNASSTDILSGGWFSCWTEEHAAQPEIKFGRKRTDINLFYHFSFYNFNTVTQQCWWGVGDTPEGLTDSMQC